MTDQEQQPAAEPDEAPAPPLVPAVVYSLRVDPDGVVTFLVRSNTEQPGMMSVSADVYAQADAAGPGRCKFDGTTVLPYAPPTPPAPQPYFTGRDVVDGMSPAQAKAADAVDPRNLARISAAARASTVKSCIARAEKDAGLAAGTLVAQATPTGT